MAAEQTLSPGDAGQGSSRPWIDPVSNSLLVLVGGACALVGFGSAYGGFEYLLVGLVGLVVGGGVVLAGMRLRQPLILIAAELLVAYLLVGSVLVIRNGGSGSSVPGPSNLAALARVTVSGWNGLLSTAPVVGDTGNLLAIPFLCAMAAGAACMGLAKRLKTAWLAVIPLIVLLAIGILFGTSATPSQLASGGLLALIILAWLAYRTRAHRVQGIGSASSRGPLRSGAVLGIACVVGLVVAPSLPGSSAHVRYVLRDHVDIPFNPLNYPSPLSAYRLYVLPKSQGGLKTTQLFRVTGAPSGSLLRIATLDAYNGIVMNVAAGAQGSSASGNFETVGSPVSQVPCDAQAQCRSAKITVTDLHFANVWLPDVGTVRAIRFTGAQAQAQRNSFRYNTSTDDAVLTSELAPGDSYTLTADVPTDPPNDKVAQAQPSQVALPSPTNVPGDVHQQALALTTGASSGFAKAEGLQQKLATLGAYSDGTGSQPASLPGHGAFRIQQFLSLPQPVGDAEQYATAMDLMAQNLGLPARLVLGAKLQPGTTVVTGGDITAWVEIKFAGVGWYPFFPTPPTDAKVRATPPPPSSSSSNQAQNPNPPAPNDGNGSVDTNAQTKSVHHSTPPSAAVQILEDVLKVVGVLAVVALVLLGPFLLIVWAKARRRNRRRTAARPSDRVSGGWMEFIDHAIDRGETVPPIATRNEVAAVMGPSAVALAERADRNVFGPAEPDEDEAVAFWTLVDDSLSEMHQSMTKWDRLKLRVNPKSLVSGSNADVGSNLHQFTSRARQRLRKTLEAALAKMNSRKKRGEA
ncbi:MAG: transglutaminase-like domain-containing protein [Acidimicrobiales bacterium]|jgi:hypothetical protein